MKEMNDTLLNFHLVDFFHISKNELPITFSSYIKLEVKEFNEVLKFAYFLHKKLCNKDSSSSL